MKPPSQPQAVTIQILDKEFRVACREEEQDALLASARRLDQKMKEVRDTGRVVGLDRIAIMAALNLTHELLECQRRLERYEQQMTPQLQAVEKRVREILDKSRDQNPDQRREPTRQLEL